MGWIEFFQVSYQLISENVFNFFSIIMNMICLILYLVGQIQFPKSMISNNSTCSLQPFGDKANLFSPEVLDYYFLLQRLILVQLKE